MGLRVVYKGVYRIEEKIEELGLEIDISEGSFGRRLRRCRK